MSIYSSIYIPRVNSQHTEESIAYYMMYHRIGTVSQVDFTPINKKPGFSENVDQVVKSAFVHFSDPWFSSEKKYYFQCKTHIENTEFWNAIANGQSNKLQINQNEYWLCFKNKNPVQRTMMNVHQIVENGRHLEGLIESQDKTILEQSNKIDELQRKLEGIHNVVYQLIGGLFHQRDQNEILSYHLDNLFCQERHNSPIQDISKWEIWPTTRQGDECENKISNLENKVRNLEYHLKI